MYGQTGPAAVAASGATGAVAVGLNVGWVATAIVTVVFVAIACWQIVRRRSVRP